MCVLGYLREEVMGTVCVCIVRDKEHACVCVRACVRMSESSRCDDGVRGEG